jgi:PAS domain S-box-containing protein
MKEKEQAREQLISELSLANQEISKLLNTEAEYKKSVQALRKSEVFFRAITQNSSDIIIIVNKTGKILFANPSIERFLGYQPDDLIGKSAFDYIVRSDIPRAIYDFGKALMTKDTVIPNSFGVLHKDGSKRILEGVGKNLLRDPAVSGFVMNVRDITDRKLAEDELDLHRKNLEDLVKKRTSDLSSINTQLRTELTERQRVEDALRESEERFRTLIQKSSDVISIFNDQGLFVYNTPSAEKVFGYSPEYLIGKSPFELIHPDDREHAHQQYNRVFNRSDSGIPTEFRFLRGDGTLIYLESLGQNLLDYPGINGIVITSRDISERKKSELEHKLLQDRLYRAEKMEALGTIAAGVAHDLNNVLGGPVGYAELLLMELPEGHRLRKHATRILNSSQKAAAIIQDMLTLARRGVAVPEVVSLNKIILDFLNNPAYELLKTYHPQVMFKYNLEKNLFNIKGSSIHLEKTVMNLLSNAAEAIVESGEVSIITENRYVAKPIPGYNDVHEGDYVVLTISDTGKGMKPGEIKNIFEPFYTKKTMGRSGTGLGLAVVWGTVTDHNGYIDVYSKDGKGSIFTVYFPATREDVSSNRHDISLDQYMGSGESILVVDDVREQQDVAAMLLTKLGYKVDTVSSGEEALNYIKVHHIDLLLLDMIMDPGIDGLETYRRILEIKPKQKAVIVSGFSETDRVKEAQKLGAETYVRKPYTLEQIGLAVRGTLQKKTIEV